MSQATEPMLVALVAALNADGQLVALIGDGGVYSGRAPVGAVLPYIVIPDMTAERMAAFRSTRYERGSLPMRIWAVDYLGVAEIYGHLQRILDRAHLVLGGAFGQVAGKVGLTTTFPDPGDTQAVQGVVSYAWIAHS